MVDFKKRLGKKELITRINPIEIYNHSLDRRSETGPLRPAQQFILEEWFNYKRNTKNQIIKLHTGQGKTLIGLLILHSRLNAGEGPCLYICPNKYLVRQTIQEAKKFGIPFCIIKKTNEIPDEFLNGEKILITHVQKVFNGKTIFGLNNNSIDVKHIILDDSHACIDALKDSFTIKINKSEPLYTKIINLFDSDLKNQGEGSYLDIKNGKYDTFLPIPYWSWSDKKSEVLRLLIESDNNTSIDFVWPFIKDNIENFKAIVSGNHIEITPYHVPIHHFSSFNDASQRILMSATTQDDAFFIKGLGFDIDSVKNPLIDPEQKWSGEKMMLLPSLIDDSLDRDLLVTNLAPPVKKQFGIVSIVPSFTKANQYKFLNSIVADNETIFDVVQDLKNGKVEQTVVIVNRYDGIDLPDNSCRILIMDSKPFFISLADLYEENCRKNSDILNTKIAQKIEQGLGRSVRGEKDYSIIILIGGDLVKFVKSSTTNKFFSNQTKQQIAIGLEIAEAAKEDLKKDDSAYKVILSLINQSLNRDAGWKEFYIEKMDEIETTSPTEKLLEILQLEYNAEIAQYNGDSETACEIMQSIIDNKCTEDKEKGWYLQILARYAYYISKVDSNTAQKSAFKNNYQLLNPKDGISYKKLEYINENRIKRIRQWINKHTSYEELMLSIDNLNDELSFGMPAEKFESALQEIGFALGFLSQRPDKEYKKGPDNLWCGVSDKYFIFECKSEVDEKRTDINKHEAAQMNSHCGWFESLYGDKEVKRVLIIPTKNLSYHGDFTHEVEIMRKNRLNRLKSNIRNFFKEFRKYKLTEISDDKIQQFINLHELGIDKLNTEYSEKYFVKR